MKVLVDSCIWSLALRRRKGVAGLNSEEKRLVSLLAEAIRDGRAVMVGPVRQEVLSGIEHEEQFEKLRTHLDAFVDEEIKPADFIEAARMDSLCRKHGVQCGVVNMLLCATALRNGWTILTTDGALLRCIDAIEREVFGTDSGKPGRSLRE